MGTDYDNAAAVNVRSFVLRYMEAHGAETRGVRNELDQLQTILGQAVARLTSSFEAICVYSARYAQQPACGCFDGTGTISVAASGTVDMNQCGPATFADGFESSINEAITTLQFYDIASQILAHAGRRIEFSNAWPDSWGSCPTPRSRNWIMC